jgi:predicted ATPase
MEGDYSNKMGHLISFGLNNFKIIKNKIVFDFRPITILTGTNSSGKSSLTKALLLWKEIIGPQQKEASEYIVDTTRIEELQIPNTQNIGKFTDLINRDLAKSGNDKMEFVFPIRLPNIEDLLLLTLIYKQDDNNNHASLVELRLSSNDLVVFNSKTISDGWASKINFTFLKEKLVSHSQRQDILVGRIKERRKTNEKPVGDPWIDFLDITPLHFDKYRGEKIAEENQFMDYQNSFRALNPMGQLNPEIYIQATDTLLDYPVFRNEPHSEDAEFNFNKKLFIERLKLYTEYVDSKKMNEPHKICQLELNYLDSFEFRHSDKAAPDLFNALARLDCSQHLNIYGFLNLGDSELKEYVPDSSFDSLGDKFKNIKAKHLLSTIINEVLLKGIKDSLNIIYKTFENTKYLPALRNTNARIIGNKTQSVFAELIYNLKSKNLQSPHAKYFILKYLRVFEIADDYKVEELGGAYRFVLVKGGRLTDLVDVGFGISQMIPIIFAIAELIENSYWQDYATGVTREKFPPNVLIIEEPECNLHPALQSKLADMFVECYNTYNIQFIIETHSEYLIRKLQFLAAKAEILNTDLSIYYFNPPNMNDIEQIRKINISRNGVLSDEFGEGFFDEADNIAIQLFNLTRNQDN